MKCSPDMSSGQKIKMKEIGELIANLLCIVKWIRVYDRGKNLSFYVWNECNQSLK